MYGLIIKKYWLDKILSGEKTLEIRGTDTSHVGELIALIESGSSIIKGFCKIQETFSLDKKRWEAETPNHCVDMTFSELKNRYKKPYAWHFCGILPCTKEITYEHPQGAVIWVDLSKTLISVGLNEYIDPKTMEYIYQAERNIRRLRDK